MLVQTHPALPRRYIAQTRQPAMTGPAIKELRLSLGATHQQFADALGCHKSQVNRWEREGVDGMRAKLLTLIAAKPVVWKWLSRLK